MSDRNAPQDGDVTGQLHTLVVGDLDRWRALGHQLPILQGMTFADVSSVTDALLQEVQPGVIISPLVAREFDAVEVARRLYELGFRGRYRIVANGVPDAALVMDEIANIAPGLDCAMMNLPGISDL